MSKLNTEKLLASVRSAQDQMVNGVLSIRDRIAELTAERAELQALPVPKTVAVERLEQWVASIMVIPGTPIVRPSSFAGNAPGYSVPRSDFDTAIASFAIPLIRQSALSMLDIHYETIGKVDDEANQAEITLLNRQLLDLELAEESIIRAADKNGYEIRRRADADPRAVLAHDSAMP